MMENTETAINVDEINARNARLQKNGIEAIAAFDELCMGPPGDHCHIARESLEKAIGSLSNYQKLGETEGINAENLKNIAKTIYDNCKNEKCYECIGAYLKFQEYLKINNLSRGN